MIESEEDTLILPLATIIETGNDIAHISNGNIRREKVTRFSKYLEKTAKDEIPAIGSIMILSFDAHLQGYKEKLTLPQRRKDI